MPLQLKSKIINHKQYPFQLLSEQMRDSQIVNTSTLFNYFDLRSKLL